jgi:hypothetical protein
MDADKIRVNLREKKKISRRWAQKVDVNKKNIPHHDGK